MAGPRPPTPLFSDDEEPLTSTSFPLAMLQSFMKDMQLQQQAFLEEISSKFAILDARITLLEELRDSQEPQQPVVIQVTQLPQSDDTTIAGSTSQDFTTPKESAAPQVQEMDTDSPKWSDVVPRKKATKRCAVATETSTRYASLSLLQDSDVPPGVSKPSSKKKARKVGPRSHSAETPGPSRTTPSSKGFSFPPGQKVVPQVNSTSNNAPSSKGKQTPPPTSKSSSKKNVKVAPNQAPRSQKFRDTARPLHVAPPTPQVTDSQGTTSTSLDEQAIPAVQVSATKSRVPPVIIREDSKWVAISRSMAEKKINFSKAKTCADGIRVQPVTSDDFRSLTRLLESQGVQFHTFTLAEDKTIRVVLRPVPTGIPAEQVLEDLETQGFHPIQVTRMSRGNKAMPLVMVEVPNKSKNIFDLRTVCNLTVSVEKPRKSGAVPQCHSCQRFFHCARNCKAQVRCVKCGGTHLTSACQKEPKEPAKCSNCGGGHTANFRGCPAFPKRKFSAAAKGKSQTAPAKPAPPQKSEPVKPLTARQEADLGLQRTQLVQAIVSAKDQKSLGKALMAFLPLLL